ncbi:MAG: DUF1761 domain-containing protein [Cyclobacteriaceae bacterium]|nr:DUF1761 domain-containing protein [Cyclobacteriaceae bacterium SS2]
MKELKINHGAVWVIVVLGQVIPMLWYGIFAEQWMSLTGLTEEDAMSGGSTPYVMSIITAIAFGYMLAWVFMRMNVRTWTDGLKTGFIMGFPIAILGTMTMYLFSMQPYALTWIDGGQNLIIWTVSGALLGGWTKEK